jgi:hypothetical protein
MFFGIYIGVKKLFFSKPQDIQKAKVAP